MKQSKLTTAILILIVSARAHGADPQSWSIPDEEREVILLRRTDGAAREGGRLKLQTRVGWLTFEDRISSDESHMRYYLAGFIDTPDPHYLVRMTGFETHGYRLVGKNTGQTIDLYGIPKFSPDGTRFVEVSLDLEAGHMPNLIRIHRRTRENYAVEWEHAFPGLKGPAHPVWLDDSALVFFEVTFDRAPSKLNLIKRPFVIELEGSTWQRPRPLR